MSTNDDPLVREARQYTASLVLRPADYPYLWLAIDRAGASYYYLATQFIPVAPGAAPRPGGTLRPGLLVRRGNRDVFQPDDEPGVEYVLSFDYVEPAVKTRGSDDAQEAGE